MSGAVPVIVLSFLAGMFAVFTIQTCLDSWGVSRAEMVIGVFLTSVSLGAAIFAAVGAL